MYVHVHTNLSTSQTCVKAAFFNPFTTMGINLGLMGKTLQARFLDKAVFISLSQKINSANTCVLKDKTRNPILVLFFFFRPLNGQLIERVATEFNKLQFYVTKSRGLPLVEQIRPVSAWIYCLPIHFILNQLIDIAQFSSLPQKATTTTNFITFDVNFNLNKLVKSSMPASWPIYL